MLFVGPQPGRLVGEQLGNCFPRPHRWTCRDLSRVRFAHLPWHPNTAPAYGLTSAELDLRAGEFNPIARVPALARARIPAILIHGDADTIVPLKDNSAAFVRCYKEAGAESLVKLIVLEGQRHNFFEDFFHSQALVDFVMKRALAGAIVER